MLDKTPDTQALTAILGEELYPVWEKLCRCIDVKYDMDQLWNKGYRQWAYEYKYRRGGKTLCTLYIKEKCIGLQIIFGKDERAKFEAVREHFSSEACRVYDEAPTFHDGKWVMYLPIDDSLFDDFLEMLALKRRPNKK